MDRRKFVKCVVASSMPGFPVVSTNCDAFIPLFLLRFLFSRAAVSAFRAAPTRALSTVEASALRRSRLSALKPYAKPRKMLPSTLLVSAGVEIHGISALSPELFKIVVNHNATTIWVMDDDKPNEFFVTGINKTDRQLSGSLVIEYDELMTGKAPEYFDHGRITVAPKETFSVKLSSPSALSGMRLIDLNGCISGISDNSVQFERSAPIVLAHSGEVGR